MMKKITLVFLLGLLLCAGGKQENKKQYVCIPCDEKCDLEVYSQKGSCPVCGMELVEKGDYDRELSYEQVQQDIQVLVTTLKANHPGIFDYQTENEFNQAQINLKEEMGHARSVLDEYQIVSKIIASVGDAHTYAMNPYYLNILQEELLFPEIPEVTENQIFLEGKRVESINGNDESEILKHLQKFSNSDGNTLPYKNAFIEMEFPLRYHVFMDPSDSFLVRWQNGESKTWKGKSYFNTGLRTKPAPPSFEIKAKTATLKIPTWEDNTASSFNNDLNSMAQNSELGSFIANAMKETIEAKSEHLIVDLRGNKGGKSGPAAILLTFLLNRPFAYYSEIQLASNSFPTKPYITNKDLVAFYQSKDAKNLIDSSGGKYFFKKELLPRISPQMEVFKGTVEVLVDKYSLSVSTDVVAILKNNREVVISGSEIGGSLTHYCAGNYLNLELPNSKIEVNIPLQRLKY